MVAREGHGTHTSRMTPSSPAAFSTAFPAAIPTSTSFEIAGCRVTRTIGVVRGITVRSPNAIQGFTAGIKSIFGGEISEFTHVCEQTREQAFAQMVAHARALGANAVVGIRYDASTLANTTEVLCYGTAVTVVTETM
jgi:uncharacterized protein YbjQ (UPF0145 family)